jgi:hypothetical protein
VAVGQQQQDVGAEADLRVGVAAVAPQKGVAVVGGEADTGHGSAPSGIGTVSTDYRRAGPSSLARPADRNPLRLNGGIIYLTKMGKDTKEAEIEGYVGGVEVILGEKFLDVRDQPMGTQGARTLVLVRGASIVAIKRK